MRDQIAVCAAMHKNDVTINRMCLLKAVGLLNAVNSDGFTMMQRMILYYVVWFSSNAKGSFPVKSFTNQKDASRLLPKHQNCEFHQASLVALALAACLT